MGVIVVVRALVGAHGVVFRLAGEGGAREVARPRLSGGAGGELRLDQLDAPSGAPRGAPLG
eukprot:8709598-Lingulodinium_polyedra.AAC.1